MSGFQSLNTPYVYWNLKISSEKMNFALPCMYRCFHDHNTNIEMSYQNLLPLSFKIFSCKQYSIVFLHQNMQKKFELEVMYMCFIDHRW